MAVRTSGPKYLEVLEPGALVNLPLEVDVFDGANPGTMLATMENARDGAVQVQLSEVGAGRFAILRSDPKATAAILAKGNLVKMKTGGVYREAWWIEEPEEVLTSEAEASGEEVRLAGRGALAYLERAVVYPAIWPVQPAGYRSASSSVGTTNTLSVAKPAGVVNGDTLVAAVAFVGGSSKVIAPPPGWVEFQRVDQATSIGVALFSKQAGSSEPAAYVWSFTNATSSIAHIVALENASPAYVSYGFAADTQGAGTAIRCPSLSIGSVDGMLLTFAAATAGTGMTPAVGTTEVLDTNATGRALESARLAGPALGDTGDLVVTNGASGAWVGISLFLPSTASAEARFEGETPGAILSTLIDRAQTRGAIPHLTYDFDGTYDSQGEPWPDTFDLTFHVGTTLLDVWRQLVALGMEGLCSHELRLSTFVDRSRDRTADVILRKGFHLLGEVTNRAHQSALRTRLLVEGAGGRVIEVTNPALEAYPVIGRREGFLSMATSDAATDLARAGAKALELSALDDQARSVPVAHGLLTDGHFEPWEDYRLGDLVALDADGTGVATIERVVGLTVSHRTALGYNVALDFNGVALEASIRLRRELDALRGTGGASPGSALGLGGSGAGGGASSGLVGVAPGDTLGWLYDKLEAVGLLVKSVGGAAAARTVKLEVARPNLDDLADVAVAGPSTGDVVTWDGLAGLWVPSPGASSAARAYLDTYSNPLDATMGDDFEAGSLNARWSRRNINSGWESFATGGGSYLTVDIASATGIQQYEQACPAGDWDFVVSFALQRSATGNNMYGLAVKDSSGNGRGVTIYTDGTAYLATIAAHAYSTFTANQPNLGSAYMEGLKVWLRLRKSGTTIYGSLSLNGTHFGPEMSVVDSSTWATVAIGRFVGTSIAQRWHIDRFDRVS